MNVLLVDDEPLALERLNRLLKDVPRVTVAGSARDGAEALEQVQRLAVDTVVMDIRMPGLGGIEAAQAMAALEAPPAVIFCTAFDQHALEAFDTHAVAYLLKPVSKEKLVAALDRARRLNAAQIAALDDLAAGGARLQGRTGSGTLSLPVSRVVALQADSKYVTAFGDRGEEILLDDSLRTLAESLGDQFVQVHRSTLVAVKAIRGLERQGSGWVVRLEGMEAGVPVSRRLLPTVRALLREQ